ncbi:MAG: hypothetical protein IKA78_05405, partial [Oscillospiraceae bacterium]|nr:hypothetical protein [Oscillospiraceae bacterium]
MQSFRKAEHRFSSLFSPIFSPEKVAGVQSEKGEKGKEKGEKNKKKKPLSRLFLFGGPEGIRTHDL